MPDDEGPKGGLGRRLGWLRSQRGLTQHDLARRLGLTQSAVSRIESGERRLSAAQLIRWAEILGVDLATLAGPEEVEAEAAQIGVGASQAQASPTQHVVALRPSDAGQGVREGGGVRRDVEDESPRATPVPSAEVPPSAIPPPTPRSPDETKAASRRSFIPGPVGHADDRLLLQRAPSESAPDTATGETSGDEGHPVALGFAASGPSAAERRRVVRTLAVEPPAFAEVVADALGLEELAARHGLPPATHVSWADRRLLGPLSPEPAQAARFWRHELGIGVEGPLPDLVTLLEEAGVHVVHARLDEQTPAGACTEVSAPRLPRSSQTRDSASTAASVLPFVFVNGARPVVLQRFALAHEFAHLALGHRDAYDERIDWSGRSGREVSANAFAEEFTAPTAAVRRWLEARGEPEIGVALVVGLANHFGISFWAARYRLRAAGRLPTRRLRELDDSLRRREWELIPRQIFLGGLRDTLSVLTAESRYAAERGANLLRMAPRGVRVPSRMRMVTLSLLERGVLSLEEAAVILRFDVPSLREQLARLGL